MELVQRRPTVVLVLILAAILLLMAGAAMSRATLAIAPAGHHDPVPSVINAGTSNHLNTLKSTHEHEQDEEKDGEGDDD